MALRIELGWRERANVQPHSIAAFRIHDRTYAELRILPDAARRPPHGLLAVGRPPMRRTWWSACMACRGRGATSTCWRRRWSTRSRQPLRVVCPDVVGRGRSDWLADPHGLPDARPTRPTCWRCWRSCTRQAPIAALDWVGTSMGGLIGMALAGTPKLPLPAPVRRLVLNDVGPGIQWQALQRIGTYLGNTGRFDTVQQAADAHVGDLHRLRPAHARAMAGAVAGHGASRCREGGFTLHYDPAHRACPSAPLDARRPRRRARPALWQLYDSIQAATLAAARRGFGPAVRGHRAGHDRSAARRRGWSNSKAWAMRPRWWPTTRSRPCASFLLRPEQLPMKSHAARAG